MWKARLVIFWARLALCTAGSYNRDLMERPVPTSLPVDVCVQIARLVGEIQARQGRLDVCQEAALAARSVVGDSVLEHGVYAGPDALRRFDVAYWHFWLRLRDGGVLDPSANQFGDAGPVRVVGYDDPRQQWYLSETVDAQGVIVYRYVPFGPGHWTAIAFQNMDKILRSVIEDVAAV
jgi:hypothetical protein